MIGRKPAPRDTPEQQILELRREVERLRETYEQRLRAAEALTRAMVAESAAGVAETLEPRIRLATREAMAYAEQGLAQHGAALRALALRLAEREPEFSVPPEPPLAAPAAAGAYVLGPAADEARDCRRLPLRDDSETAFLADLAHLPIPPGGATKLVAAHIVEFAPHALLRDTVLPHWRSRLAPAGELVVLTLDGPAWSADLARLGGDFDALRARLGADGVGRPPRHLLDAESLANLLTEAGLAPEPATRTPPFGLRIAARAPGPAPRR